MVLSKRTKKQDDLKSVANFRLGQVEFQTFSSDLLHTAPANSTIQIQFIEPPCTISPCYKPSFPNGLCWKKITVTKSNNVACCDKSQRYIDQNWLKHGTGKSTQGHFLAVSAGNQSFLQRPKYKAYLLNTNALKFLSRDVASASPENFLISRSSFCYFYTNEI